MTDTIETTLDPEQPSRYTILTSETPEPEAVEPEAVEPEEATEPDAPDIESEPEHKKDAQSRIRELANTNRELKARLAEIEAAKQTPVSKQDGEPNPDDYVGGVYNDKYRADLRDYDRQVARAEVQAEQNSRAIEAEKQKVIARENEFKKTNPEYDYAVKNFMASGLADDGLADILVEMPNWLELVNTIGNDDDLVDAMVAMTPAQRLIKIGALSAAGQSGSQTATAKRVSNAPAPITPARGGAVLTGEAALNAALKPNENGHLNYDAYKAAVKAAGK